MSRTLWDIEGLGFEVSEEGEFLDAELDVTDVVLDLIASHEEAAQLYATVDDGEQWEDLHQRTADFLSVFLESGE